MSKPKQLPTDEREAIADATDRLAAAINAAREIAPVDADMPNAVAICAVGILIAAEMAAIADQIAEIAEILAGPIPPDEEEEGGFE